MSRLLQRPLILRAQVHIAWVCIATALVCDVACGSTPKTRVIVDTDIGDNIDDAWALAILLANDDVNVGLVVADSYLPEKRAEVLARFMTLAGKAPPIAIGPGLPNNSDTSGPLLLAGWAGPSDLASYPGTVSRDSSQAIIDAVRAGADAGETTVLVVLSPSTAVSEALRQGPWIPSLASVVVMGGSLRAGDNGTGPPYAEWNLRTDVRASRALLGAPWLSLRLAPLDAAATAQLAGPAFDRVRHCPSPLAEALEDMRAAWLPRCPWPACLAGPLGPADGESASAVIYDAAAVTLLDALAPDAYFRLEDVRVSIADDGSTLLEDSGFPLTAATSWTNARAWEDLVASTLCGPSERPAEPIPPASASAV